MPDAHDHNEPKGGIDPRAQAPLIVGILFLAYMGQMILNPIIAPLARQIGLQEWHIGATISLAAIVVALFSTYWGRTSQRIGAKHTLATGMVIAIVALSAFGVISFLGQNQVLSGVGLVIGVIFTRGILYGAGISSVAPTAQMHLVTHTTSENGRVKALGMIGAAQGISSIIGGIVGGVLAAIGGLLLPLVVMPIVMLAGLVILLVSFKPYGRHQLLEKPQRIHYADPRISPWLIAGLMMFLVFSSLTTVFGFTVQDRFGLSANSTAAYSSLYMAIMGVAMIIAQAVIAPKSGWSASKLLRRGLVVILVATLLILPTSSYILLGVACIFLGFGMGLSIPGYTTGPTLNMDTSEQGSIAGMINANNAIAYALAPIVSTSLYEWNSNAPFVICVLFIAIVVAYTYISPVLRH